MEEDEYKKYLIEKKVESQTRKTFLKCIRNYERFLQEENKKLETSSPNNIFDYSEYLLSANGDSVLDFLGAMMHYANFSKRYEFITKIIDMSESYNAMDNLHERVGVYYGESLRNEIFKDLTIPPLGIHPEKKPKFTKEILKRLKETCGEDGINTLFSKCLHGRPPDDIEGDRRLLKELGIDNFLEKKHKDLVARLERHRDEETLEFAQKVDDQVIQVIKDNQMIGQGIRKGNIVYVSKIPYQMKEYLNTQDERMKKFYICYCPWIRGAFKDGTEKEIMQEFCHCSANWYKLYWDQIFQQPIKVEPVKTALGGALECRFAIHLPKNFLNLIKQN